MLTMSPVHSIDYYIDFAAEDYYIGAGEPSGEWAGKGATLLGLRGAVDEVEYQNILRGLSPTGTHSLRGTLGGTHRPGWDLTFSAPKSVSLVWARGEEELRRKVERAHNLSVTAALAFLERHAAIARRGHNGSVRETAAGLTAILFQHSTSRALDPQLHTHCLVANCAPRTDGSWGCIESRDLYVWQKAAGSMYRAELASQIREIGFSVEQSCESFRIAGIGKEICDQYSKRGLQIRKELEQRGHAKSASKIGDLIALSTRERKSSVDRVALFRQWQCEFDELGFNPGALAALLYQQEQPFQDPFLDSPLDPKKLTAQLTERASVFREQDVYKLAAEMAQWSGANCKSAERAAAYALKDPTTIVLGHDSRHNRIYSTRHIIKQEIEMIAGAKRLRARPGYSVTMGSLNLALAQKEFPLSDEQHEAVLSVCQDNSFAVLQGSAGAGKSASMDCVRAAYENEGFQVIGAAVAKLAAANLAQEANLKSFTIAKLLTELERGSAVLDASTVLLIDEAGQLGTGQLLSLISAAENFGSKVVLIGEDRQLDAIEHGGSLRYLSKHEVLGVTRIETIRRQGDEWARRAVADFRDGRSLSALEQLNRRDLLRFCDGADEAKTMLVKEWNMYRKMNPEKKLNRHQ